MKILLYVFISLVVFFTLSAYADGGPITSYHVITSGNIEELKKACRNRSLSDSGSVIELRRRLMDHVAVFDVLSFESRLAQAGEGAVVLEQAEVIEAWEDENGEKLVRLRGNVDISYSGKTIHAAEVHVNPDSGIIVGYGNVNFIDGEKHYRGESVYYNLNTEEGFFNKARTEISDFLCTGETIRILHESDKFMGSNLSLTTCGLKDPHYRIDAETLYFYDNEKLLVQDPSLVYGSVPVLNFPFLYRNIRDRRLHSTIFFRERSGIVNQNTYSLLDEENRELKLKGDFYERLGVYAGADFSAAYPSGAKTTIQSSAALSNDLYFYDDVTENWSPFGPPSASEFSIERYMRYHADVYQLFRFGEGYTNDMEFHFQWISDPYYRNDFERRSEQFDLFDFIGQAQIDEPRKDEGFSWYVNDYFSSGAVSLSVENEVEFEPQRNIREDTVSLPDYYIYEIYTLNAPYISLSHTKSLFQGSSSPLISDISYTGGATYNHILYYNERGAPSSELHEADTALNFRREYELFPLVRFTPGVEIGAQGQHHVEGSSDESLSDRQNSLVYTRVRQYLKIGSPRLYLDFSHDFKYKLFGPDDDFTYNDFRINELEVGGFAGNESVSDRITTSVDLRPVFDWQEMEYKPLLLSGDRFTPIINTLTISPFPALSLEDRLVYDISRSRFKENSFGLNYRSNSIYLGGGEFSIEWDVEWRHFFVNPLLDTLVSEFGVNAPVHPNWTLYLTVVSRNDDMWRYFPKTAGRPINPLIDLLKSFNFFNSDDRKESNFKMKSISLGFVHDLHDWELRFDYTGTRELSYDGSKYIWDNVYSVSLGLKEAENIALHTTYSERR